MSHVLAASGSVETSFERGVNNVLGWVGAGVGAVLAWAAVAPEVGFVGEAVAAVLGGVVGKAVTDDVTR